MEEKIIRKILKYADENPDGFTIKLNAKTGKITTVKFNHKLRYAVSLTNNTSKKQIMECLQKLPNNYNGYIGGWKDTKTEEYYIDITVIVSDIHTAKLIGKKFKQKAIWDGLEFKEIWINEKM